MRRPFGYADSFELKRIAWLIASAIRPYRIAFTGLINRVTIGQSGSTGTCAV
jgi:hypothetical protein